MLRGPCANSHEQALKVADRLLVAKPKHGDTMCARGLVLYESGRHADGKAACEEGLRNAFKSFLAWDIMSRVHLANHDKALAIKCMKSAIANEPTSDRAAEMRVKLAHVQFSAADYVGFLETRTQLLSDKPVDPRNWGPCAVAAQFAGELPTAIQMMDKYLDTLRSSHSDMPPSEMSELLFYKTELLMQLGDFAGALRFVEAETANFTETRRLREILCKLYLALQRPADAAPVALELVAINTEDARYHEQLQRARGVAGNVEALLTLYVDELQPRFAQSQMCRRIPLDFLPGTDARFGDHFRVYVRRLLEKGAPSAFASIKSLYADAAKVAAMSAIVEADLAAVQSPARAFAASTEPVTPSTYVWMLYYGAQHYDALYRWPEALACVALALAHTPTLVELYVLKGRIAKHMGDVGSAHALCEMARVLDTADRWLNTVTVRYALRAGLHEEAEQRLGLFAKADEATINVFEMQHQAYMVQLARCHRRAGRIGHALKLCAEVEKVYAQFDDDHAQLQRFSMNLNTVGAWSDMGRSLRTSRAHPMFVAAIGDMVEIYLDLAVAAASRKAIEDAAAAERMRELEQQWAALAPKDRKQAEKNYKKAEARKADDKAAASTEEAASAVSHKSLVYMRGDPDPIGELLLHHPEPLERARHYAALLVEGAPRVLRAQLLYGRVAVVRNHVTQALQALLAAHELAPTDPATRTLAAHVLHMATPEPPLAALRAARTQSHFLGAASVAAYLEAWAATTDADALAQRAARASCRRLLLNDPAALKALAPPRVSERKDAEAVLALLADDAAASAAWKALCVAVFPHAAAFGGTRIATPECDVFKAPTVDEQPQ